MKLNQVIRLVTVTAISGVSIFTLSGFFFFILPLGLLLPDDKKTVTELEQKQDWPGLVSFADKRIQSASTGGNMNANTQMYSAPNTTTVDGVQPAEAPWLYIKGIALGKMQRCSEAIPVYQRAIKAKSGVYPDAKNNLGLCQLDLRQYDAAIITFKDLIGTDPNYWQAYFNAGIVSVQKIDIPAANAYEQQLRTRNMAMAETLRNLHIKPLETKLELEALKSAAKSSEQDRAVIVSEAERSGETTKTLVASSEPTVKVAIESQPARHVSIQNSEKSVETQLAELKNLADKGLISKDVYESKQREILRMK